MYRMSAVKHCRIHTSTQDMGREVTILLLEYFSIEENLAIPLRSLLEDIRIIFKRPA